MKIAIRNPERAEYISGYGVINRALTKIIATVAPEEADVHLFISPPYSFTDLDSSKFNVGLTMTERHDLSSYKWHGKTFPDFANKMDLLIAPGQWCRDIFTLQLSPPTEVVLLGHDHDSWVSPVRHTKNKSVFIMDRGRDQRNADAIVAEYFSDINSMNCNPPKPSNEKNVAIIKNGRYPQDTIRKAYLDADVFFKWGREGWCFPNLEAMSSGCLVITNCAHLGYVEDGKNCLVFRGHDDLKAKLTLAAEQPLTEIKEAGQRTAASLTWAKTRQGILDAITKHMK